MPSAQTSVSGNAGTATKLATARTIALSGAATGTATSFNGTANITIPVTSLDGSKITGTIPLSSIPKGAQERLVPVTDETAMLALTADDVQSGDTVKNADTEKMYFVVDTNKLGTMDAFIVYTAGAASAVPWAGITDKPDEVVSLATKQADQDTAIQKNAADIATNSTSIAKNAQDIADLQAGAVVMTGASATDAGKEGYVPAPSAGQESLFLMGDGTWGTIAEATQNTSGVMSAADKQIVDKVKEGSWDFGDEG